MRKKGARGTSDAAEPLDVEGGVAEAAFLRDVSRWTKAARQVSVVSIAFTLVAGCVGIWLYRSLNSVAMLGYSLEAFVDVWSSILVLWRFWDDTSQEDMYEAMRREHRAEVGIAFTFLGIGVIVGREAYLNLIGGHSPDEAGPLLIMSSISMVALTVLAVVKLRIAAVLKSPSLQKDGITSGAVAFISAGILIGSTAFHWNPDVWWVDSAVALLVSILLFLYGVATLALLPPWWKVSFWRSPPTLEKSSAP